MNSWLVIGLGNPGPTYAKTRHNVGFLSVEALSRDLGAEFSLNSRQHAVVALAQIPASPGKDNLKLVLAKPITYMNMSGRATATIAKFYKIPAENIIVIHDELDLPPGSMRIKFGGGDNGHNGLKSIRAHLGTGDFYRIRIGIGRAGSKDPADYVLAKMSKNEFEAMCVDAAHAADSVEMLINQGLAQTQNKFNS